MGSVKQGIKIKRAKNKNAKFRIVYSKYTYKKKGTDKQQVKYSYKKRVFGKKYKYVYKYS